MRFFLYTYYHKNMAGCTKERFGGHVKKQRGAGYGREKFEASRKMKKSQNAGGHCWMHKKSKKMRKGMREEEPRHPNDAVVCALSLFLSLSATNPPSYYGGIYILPFFLSSHTYRIDHVWAFLSLKVPKFPKILGTYRVNDAIDLQSVSRDQKCIQI